ncbi:MAG: hypothetical protein J6K75_03380 [Erysipelotrichaceae bacterium]|nr:hypothetical protein [Erysipelotrichaceae bacterium]MBQ7890214.1 hypothetical protein [Erysipelotrichaceae bacterium]
MKHRLIPYYLLCTGIYVGLFLVELVLMQFVLQMFTSNTLISVTAALPMLLFVNPVVTWLIVEYLTKKKK